MYRINILGNVCVNAIRINAMEEAEECSIVCECCSKKNQVQHDSNIC